MIRTTSTIMTYVARLKDEGMRKVMTMRLSGYSNKQISRILKIRESTVETIGKKGALSVKEAMYRDMSRQGVIVQ